jgi:hypothetical protein
MPAHIKPDAVVSAFKRAVKEKNNRKPVFIRGRMGHAYDPLKVMDASVKRPLGLRVEYNSNVGDAMHYLHKSEVSPHDYALYGTYIIWSYDQVIARITYSPRGLIVKEIYPYEVYLTYGWGRNGLQVGRTTENHRREVPSIVNAVWGKDQWDYDNNRNYVIVEHGAYHGAQKQYVSALHLNRFNPHYFSSTLGCNEGWWVEPTRASKWIKEA